MDDFLPADLQRMVEADNNERASAKIIPPGDAERNRHPIVGPLFVAVIVVAIVIFLTFAFVPLSTQPEPTTVYILHPAIERFLGCVWLGTGAVLIVAAIWCACIRWLGRATLAFVLAIGGMPASYLTCAIRNLGPWTPQRSVTATDDHLYSYVESGFLQGQTLAIGRDEGSGRFYHQYRLMGDTNGDSPRLWIPLVRPAGVNDDEYGQLYCSDSGVVVGLRYENHCFMAYDVHTDQFFGHLSNGATGDEITAISPFILIGPDTQLHQPDVARIFKMRSDPAHTEGVVSGAALQQALDHPNPAVRKLARQLLGEAAGRADREN
jgi:hypothetical protein